MKPGTLVKYTERFLAEPLLGVVLKIEDLGPTDYIFYKIILEDGRQLVIADTRLCPV